MKLQIKAAWILGGQRGAVLVLVAALMLVFVGITALAVDLGHLYVVRNELQNAADAGALAGASNLINPSDGSIRSGANQIAYDTALMNSSVNLPVEVNWAPGTNTGDVQRGHWSFSERKFTPVDTLSQVELHGRSEVDLDLMDGSTPERSPAFINAVRVATRREDSPAPSFFAGLFGFDSFTRSAEAVAYLGFTGDYFTPDQPIAICKESIQQLDSQGRPFFDCNIGRMINSGNNPGTSNTAGWTDFNQEGNPCQGGANATTVRDMVCRSQNSPPPSLTVGNKVGTSGGEIQTAFNRLADCWEAQTGKTEPWKLTLTVIECPGNNVSNCEKVVGAVTVEVVWINAQNDPQYNRAPTQMGDWSSNSADGKARWDSFVEHFNLKNVGGNPAPYANKSIYFKPSCEYNETPYSKTGGTNFGMLAQIPVLVR